MNYIRKLPVLMALASAIIVGLLGHAAQLSNKENLLRMIIVMIIFYIAGFMVSSTVTDIIKFNKKKAEEKEKEKRIIQEEKDGAEPAESGEIKQAPVTGQLNLAAADDINFADKEEDFDALNVAEFIKKELNQ